MRGRTRFFNTRNNSNSEAFVDLQIQNFRLLANTGPCPQIRSWCCFSLTNYTPEGCVGGGIGCP